MRSEGGQPINLHAAVTEVRAVVARAGEADRLGWWPSSLYSSGDAVLKRLFPHTYASAASTTLNDAIRRKEGTADSRSALLSLFFLGGQREALIAQEETRVPSKLLLLQPDSGAALAKALLEAYEPILGDGYWEHSDRQQVNEARGRVDVAEVSGSHLDEAHLKIVVGKLIAGLRFSTQGHYLPPVVRLDRHRE